MSPIPVGGGATLTVSLDVSGTNFGDAATWTDVSADVLAGGQAGALTTTWGRQDQYSDVQPSTGSNVFKNEDGRYTSGKTGLVANLLSPDQCAPGCVTNGTTAFSLGSASSVTIDTAGTYFPAATNAHALKVTVPASVTANSKLVSTETPVTAGSVYSFAMWINNPSGAGTPMYAIIVWKNSAGSTVGTSTGSAVFVNTTGWSTLANQTAPAGSVTASLRLQNTTTTSACVVAVTALNLCSGATVSEEQVTAYYPNIRRLLHRQAKIHLASTDVYLLDDFASSLPVAPQKDLPDQMTLSGADILARFGGTPSSTDVVQKIVGMQLRSFLAEEMLVDSPSFLYQLQEAEGSTSFGDTTGVQQPATIANSKYGPGIVEAGTDPTGTFVAGSMVAITNAAYPADPIPSAGSFLSATGADLSGANTFSFEVWIQTSTVAGTGAQILEQFTPDGNRFGFYIGSGIPGVTVANPSGAIVSILGPTSICDGNVHHLAATVNGTAVNFYVDNVNIGGTHTLSAASVGPAGGPFNLGMSQQGYPLPTPNSAFTGAFAYAAVYPTTLSAARISAHYNAGTNGFTGERTDARIARLLSYRPNLGSSLDTGLAYMGSQDIAGTTLQQALLDVAQVEGGVVYVNGQGQVCFRSRSDLFNPASVLTLDCQAGSVDFGSEFNTDTQGFYNDVTVTRPNGADQRFFDQDSIDQDGDAATSFTLNLDTDENALSSAQWIVANGVLEQRTATPLIVSLTHVSSSVALAVLQLKPLDCITVTNCPASAPGSTMQFIVQGGSLSFVMDGASTATLNTTPLPLSVVTADPTSPQIAAGDTADSATYVAAY